MGDKKIAGAMIQNTVNLIVCLKDQKQFELAEKYLKKTLDRFVLLTRY